MKHDMERELLEWKKGMLELRRKYRDTPPGFQDDRTEQAYLDKFSEEQEAYRKKREHYLEAFWESKEEPFAGREPYLKRIWEIFRLEKGPAVLYGIGGIGKTAIARAYALRFRKEYNGVLFLSCSGDFQMVFGDDVRLPISNFRYSQDKYGGKGRSVRDKLKIRAPIAGKQRLRVSLAGW